MLEAQLRYNSFFCLKWAANATASAKFFCYFLTPSLSSLRLFDEKRCRVWSEVPINPNPISGETETAIPLAPLKSNKSLLFDLSGTIWHMDGWCRSTSARNNALPCFVGVNKRLHAGLPLSRHELRSPPRMKIYFWVRFSGQIRANAGIGTATRRYLHCTLVDACAVPDRRSWLLASCGPRADGGGFPLRHYSKSPARSTIC